LNIFVFFVDHMIFFRIIGFTKSGRELLITMSSGIGWAERREAQPTSAIEMERVM